MTNDPIRAISQEQFDDIIERSGIDPAALARPETAESEPPDRHDTASRIGDVLYAWQMQVNDGWNIIGMQMPQGGALPLVTTSLPMAWEAFEVAQAHANRSACQVRLAAFTFDSLAAVVEPND